MANVTRVPCFFVLVALAGACGGDDGSSPPASGPGGDAARSGNGGESASGGSAGSGNGGGAGTLGGDAGGPIEDGSAREAEASDGPSNDVTREGGLVAIAAELDHFRLECPCIDADHFGLDKQDNCDQVPTVDRQTYKKTLRGDPNVTYDVTLHVRGDTEPNTYVNGKLEQNRFYTGGETSTPGYTAYMLSVDLPKQVYFFNYNPTTSHIHFLIDYQVVIPMKGGTSVTFDVNGGKSVPDGHGVSNRERLVVPGIAPAPDPFNGQLVQFDVVSVQAQ